MRAIVSTGRISSRLISIGLIYAVILAPLMVEAQAPPAATPPAAAPVTPPARPVSVPASLNLTNASLTEVIDILARDLKINYILDPRIQGKVTINTYGEIRAVDVRNLLETILRMNGFAMVQVGNVFRIVPSDAAARLPISPQTDFKDQGESEQVVLDLVFLKFVSSSEMIKVLEPFVGEGAKVVAYDPANLLIIQDNSRNMHRTLELISMFDSETLAGQRVKTFALTNVRPSDIAKELDAVFKAYAFSDKNSAIRFVPIDRINTVIALAPNPAALNDVSSWVAKLDVPIRAAAGAIDNHVYRLKYGRAEILGQVVSQLYGGSGGSALSGYGLNQSYGGYRSNGTGGFGSVGGNGGFGSLTGGSNGGFGGSNSAGNGGGAFSTAANQSSLAAALPPQTAPVAAAPTGAASGAATTTPFGAVSAPDQTGSYLQPATGRAAGYPRIIPNPYDNTLLVQGTPEQWESIQRLLEQIDVAPRQVLIDARIYEVSLKGTLGYGVEALLQQTDNSFRNLLGNANNGGVGLSLTQGLLVGHSRELLATVTAAETRSLAKAISRPQLIATDSIPASITVGEDIPTPVGTVSSGVLGGSTSVIQSRGTGVNLNVIARVNASGIVTLVVEQDVSAPEAASYGSTGAPSFSRRNVSTQVTVQDGDTVAIGGIIQETVTHTINGIPFLDRIPVLGGAFGKRADEKDRTELIVFLTPHVIYDTNQISDATEELKSHLKDIRKMTK